MKSYADVFIDPVTGNLTGGTGGYSLAKFIVQTACPDLPNAQALDELKDGIMFKVKDGKIVTDTKLNIDELPPLGGAIIKGVFRGNVWRGSKNGKVEESDALSNCVVDLALLNTKLIIANFVMGSSLVPQAWQGATFLDKMPNGILWNCAPEQHGKYKDKILRRANPNVDYMQPDLKANKIWMGVDDPEYDAETKQVTVPWIDATYITKTPLESSPHSQALSQLEIEVQSLIFVTAEGDIKPAKLRSNSIWCGNNEDKPAERRLDFITTPKYILQSGAEYLDNAQALDELTILSNGILKVNNSGVISEARAGEDYATTEQLDEAVEKAETAATEAEASAEEATVSAGAATTAATEATGAAGEANASAGTAAASAAAAVLSATGASLSAGSASSSASSASSSADNAKQYSEHAEEEYNKFKSTEIKLTGDIEGEGKPDEEIATKIKDNPVFEGNTITLAGGLISDRPANPIKGMFRYLSSEESPVVKLEFYNGEVWKEIA